MRHSACQDLIPRTPGISSELGIFFIFCMVFNFPLLVYFFPCCSFLIHKLGILLWKHIFLSKDESRFIIEEFYNNMNTLHRKHRLFIFHKSVPMNCYQLFKNWNHVSWLHLPNLTKSYYILRGFLHHNTPAQPIQDIVISTLFYIKQYIGNKVTCLRLYCLTNKRDRKKITEPWWPIVWSNH